MNFIFHPEAELSLIRQPIIMTKLTAKPPVRTLAVAREMSTTLEYD